MRLLFHNNQLCLRGTSVAMFDYATFNESLLHNDSFVTFNSRSPFNDPRGIAKFQQAFPSRVFAYESIDELNLICDRLKIDCCYMIKGGENDKILTDRKNLIHAVFQSYDPHGDIYAYVSEWLSKRMTDGQKPFVPHIVHLPEPTGTIRSHLSIPDDAIVFGRYGGVDQFDIPFVREAVIEFTSANANCWFLFMNTIPFVNHPRIIFLDGTSNVQLKANFIESCDAMIHARTMGESFGLSICEFLYGNKPVFAWNGGNDLHHVDVLKDCDTLYSDKKSLIGLMSNVRSYNQVNYRNRVDKFSPETVMEKFNEVFLKNSL